jgi:hypothetical protein
VFEITRFVSMNGTLLLRRSASIVLASSLLFVAACGVELGGLFEGDAGVDGAAPRDGGDAAPTADRASDIWLDVTTDGAFTDGGVSDGGSSDRSANDRVGADATIDPVIDARVDLDAARDAGPDGDITRDASADADADARIDARLDGRDADLDPTQDGAAEDATEEPAIDVTSDGTLDALDARVDASRDAADAGPPGTCGGACNTFPNISPPITRTVVQGSPPTMTGGTIVDGTYLVTSIIQYNGDSTPYSLSETSVIGGNIDAWVASTNGQPPVRFTTTFTTTNNQMAFTFCCPTAGNLTISYTTDGATLSHIDAANPNRVITYTRQ